MKTLQNYITEKILINKNSKIVYNYYPKTKNELKDIINQKIESEGNDCNLNDIDTSNIIDMSYLFLKSDFNGDISNWNVSSVKIMYGMFAYSKFNGDISDWDVSNVTDMSWMFYYSKFKGDIASWNVASVSAMDKAFERSPLENNPPKWYKRQL